MDTTQNTTPVPEEQLEQHTEKVVAEVNNEIQEVDFSDEEAHLALEDEEFQLGGDELESEEETQPNQTYSELNIEGPLTAFRDLFQNKPIETIRKDVEQIKVAFYRQYKQEVEKDRKEYLDAGGDIEVYQAPENASEKEFKALFAEYKNKRNEYMQQFEVVKEQNLKLKLQVIEELKQLIDKKEDINRTFAEFRELQQKWKEIGPIPQANVRDTWDTYNHYVEKFYDYIKINRELRDLDLKKNLEIKTLLCEKVEELDKEEQVVLAFRKLQKYHEEWREVGPVPAEFKDSLWERFKEATSEINKKHQGYFESQKEEQQKNLEAKTLLCEKVEAINTVAITTSKEWSTRSKEIIELQNEWKTLGLATRKENAKLYERFRKACDTFFANKRQVFNNIKKELEENLQKKIALCERAEELAESSDWKKTTDELIALQKEWKTVGIVPRKVSDSVWQRFRKACDKFFERKNENYTSQNAEFIENQTLKEALIAEINSFEATDNPQADVATLKDFQRKWDEIGFVPIKEKDRIQKEYRAAIDAKFKSLRMSDTERKITRYKSKIESIQPSNKSGNKTLRSEREKLFNQIRQLEADITLWENNIGFFAKSKNAEPLIADVKKKIEHAKQEIIVLEEKIKLIDKQYE
ncbi:MAG: DUF349 domain-containing protein [Prevotellaceae bacterium]|jgi:peptidase E|nr:DUF349 domain-containing protein [Prevotellaceae bacterium]